MSRNRATIVLVAIASVIVGVVATLIFQDSSRQPASLTQLNRKTEPGKPPRPVWENEPAIASQPKDAAGRVIASNNLKRSSFPKPTLESPPQAKQVREDAAVDSHSTPQALLEFAENLALSMQGAFADQETRYTVSRQLIACARDAQARGSAQAARALCLANLERLKNKFPEELSPSFQSLMAELPDDLLFVAGVSKTSEEK